MKIRDYILPLVLSAFSVTCISQNAVAIMPELTATGYPAHIELKWHNPDKKNFNVYRSLNGKKFKAIGTTSEGWFLDFPSKKTSDSIFYKIRENGKDEAEYTASAKMTPATDDNLLDMVQKYTTRYFHDYADPVTGMARERNNDKNGNIVTTGGTGFGIMALIAGSERGYISRDDAYNDIEKIVNFLESAERFHGAWAHWYNAKTGNLFNFSEYDDGGDLVETAYLAQGLLAAKSYFMECSGREKFLSYRISKLWYGIDWNWYTNGTDSLYWHWSKNYGWKMNHRIKGFDETLITYVLAASSPLHPIPARVYESCYKNSPYYYNGKSYYGIKLVLGMEYGGPLFFAHYSFLGLDPRGLKDSVTNYFDLNKAHALIHRAYAIDNPKGHKGLGANLWGFTSSDDALVGYSSHHPGTNDENGTVAPTAAISSIVYTPKESMEVLRHLYMDYGKEMFSEYGFYDAFNPGLKKDKQVVKSYLAIDQGPIAVMIENYRSGLLWKLFMSNPEIDLGLRKLGFYY